MSHPCWINLHLLWIKMFFDWSCDVSFHLHNEYMTFLWKCSTHQSVKSQKLLPTQRYQPWDLHYITITVLHFYQQEAIIYEVIEVHDNIGMIKQRKNFSFLHCTTSLLFICSWQVNFLPYNQTIILQPGKREKILTQGWPSLVKVIFYYCDSHRNKDNS